MTEKTYVQQRQDMIRTFGNKAKQLAEMLKWYNVAMQRRGVNMFNPYHNEDFQNITPDPIYHNFYRPPYYIKRNDGEYIRFQFSSDTCIDIGNFRVVPGEGMVNTPPPTTLEEVLTGSNDELFENNTDRPRKRSREFEDYQVVTSASEVSEALSIKAGLQLRQMFSYGSEVGPVQGETEVTASIETEVSRAQSSSHSKEQGSRDVGGFEDDVPPWTNMLFVRDLYRTKCRQDAHIDGNLDWMTWVWSRDDYEFRWDSKRDIEACFKGVGLVLPGRVYEDWCSRHPVPEILGEEAGTQRIDEFIAPVSAKFTVSHEYDGAMRTRYRFEDQRTPEMQAKYDAWRAEQRAGGG